MGTFVADEGNTIAGGKRRRDSSQSSGVKEKEVRQDHNFANKTK